jgi:16S rRNA processing protein RimM
LLLLLKRLKLQHLEKLRQKNNTSVPFNSLSPARRDFFYLQKTDVVSASCIRNPESSILHFMPQYFKIGKLAASTGLKGELVLQHSLGKKTSLKGLDAIFLQERTDSFIPYFIQSTQIRSDSETVIKLEGIDVMETARKLTPKEVWLTEVDFKKFAAASSAISLLGFNVINEGNDLGEILEVIEQPHQLLCTIMIDGKEALIPIHEESLEKIDKKNRKVFVTLPDGLLDIYR